LGVAHAVGWCKCAQTFARSKPEQFDTLFVQVQMRLAKKEKEAMPFGTTSRLANLLAGFWAN